MTCWLRNHEWGWPRRRGDLDTQVCVKCGASRPATIQFGSVHTGPANTVKNKTLSAAETLHHHPAGEISVVH